MYTVKKTRKNSIANIFVIFHFKEKQKKWNSKFTILHIPCKFQQNLPKKVAVGLNGLSALFQVFQNLTSSEKQHMKHLEKLLSKFKIITKTK